MPAVSTLAEAKLDRLRRLQELQAELKRLKDLDDGAVKRPWKEIARPEQLAPAGDWFTWLILAGRGLAGARAVPPRNGQPSVDAGIQVAVSL